MIHLRPDQFQLKAEVYTDWNAGARNVLAVLPTGGGKSVIVSDVVLDGYNIGMQQVIAAHRTELTGQMSLHIARRGIKHRIIAPNKVISQVIAEHRREFNGYSFVNPDANCTVAAVDTLNARAKDLERWAKQIDQWIIDEAHHLLLENKWGRATGLFPNARGLGVTATPRRADGKGLGRHHDGVFDTMRIGPDMRTLINLGALTDYEIAIPDSDFHIDDDDLPPGGDYTVKKMREASKRSHIVGDVVKEYIKRAYGKRGICFATDVETANEIAQNFNNAGIPTAAVSAETPAEVRADYIRRFRDGRLWMLVNVDLFGEGFDVPAVEVVIMARPTASLAVYLQQFGRALRVLFGKLYGLIIDHVSNWKRHGFPDKPHYWTLDRRDKKAKREKDPEEMPLTACRNCSRPYELFHPKCPHCGHAPELTPVERTKIECVDGDLILLDRDKLAQMRAAIELPSPQAVGTAAGYAAGPLAAAGAVNRQIEKIQAHKRLDDAICQWAGVQRALGRSDQSSYRRFYHAAGIDVVGALDASRTRQDYEALALKVEGWISNACQTGT